MSSKKTIIVTPNTVVAPPQDAALEAAVESTTAGIGALMTQFVRHTLYTGMHAIDDRLQAMVNQRLEIADYLVEDLRLYIVRKHAAEFAACLRHSPETVRREHQQLHAIEAGGSSCLIVIEGKHDEIPEQDFYMAGTIDDVLEKFRKRQAA